MTRKSTINADLTLIQRIDDADVDLPFGESDFIEQCLIRLLKKARPLSARSRVRARALLGLVQNASAASSASYDEDIWRNREQAP